MRYVTRQEMPEDLKVGIFLVARDQPLITTMAGYHPDYSPQYDDFGDTSQAQTWFDAYFMQESLLSGIAEADQSGRDYLEVEINLADDEGDKDYVDELIQSGHDHLKPDLMLAAVDNEGNLYFVEDFVTDTKDFDLEERFERADYYYGATRDEIYQSHGITLELAGTPSL